MNFWLNKKVAVTGGNGFLGKFVVEGLRRKLVPRENIYVPNYDLRITSNVGRMYFEFRPDIVIHLAATVGGIQKNRTQPATMFYDNLKMGMEIIDVGKRYPAKIVMMGSACEYPKDSLMPLQEWDIWNGKPEPTNASYGIAKRALLEMGQAYVQQYGMNIIHLLPTNLYGPGDNANLETSHVVMAMIVKFLYAAQWGSPFVELWGSGSATRDFLYVKDAAEGVLDATEYYNNPVPVNLGSGKEVAIHALAAKVAELTGYRGEIRWNNNMPDGQPRRVLDTYHAKRFGWESFTSLDQGLRETIGWYKACVR